MKIAVTFENGEIFQHFGKTEAFKIYEVDGGKIVSSEIVKTEGEGHGAMADFLASREVKILICGGIGEGAKQALNDAGIKLYSGIKGTADNAMAALMDGTLVSLPDGFCSHHDYINNRHTCGGNHGNGIHHHCGHHGAN